MENTNENKGNPTVVEDAIFGSQQLEENFFDKLDQSVNGLVHDDPKPEKQDSLPQQQVQATSNPGDVWESDNNPYKKRYSDSSREAIEQRTINKDNEKYSAVIDVMKKDPKVVDVVREYLEGGQTPASAKEAMGVDEDFVFDPDEAMSNPASDSAKMLNGYVEQVAQKRIAETVNSLQAENEQQSQQNQLERDAQEFKTRTGMTDSQFNAMIENANSKKLTYDDLHYLVNRDVANKQVASGAKKDMLDQMKKAQSIPHTLSGQGSVKPNENVSHEGRVFEQLKSLDLDLDNLFD